MYNIFLKKTFLMFLFFIVCVTKNFAQCYYTCDSNFDCKINNINLDSLEIESLSNLLTINVNKVDLQLKKSSLNYKKPFYPTCFSFINCYIIVSSIEDRGCCPYIEIGYMNSNILKQNPYIINKKKEFNTNNEIKLGLTQKQFYKKIKFDKNLINYTKVVGNYVIYQIECSNYNTSSYNQNNINIYSRPTYIARYVFYKNKLIKFSFGNLPFHPTHEFEGVLF